VLSVSFKIDKTGYHAVIKFFVKEDLMPHEIHSKFIKVYVDFSPLFSTTKKWAAEFKRGLYDDPRKGHTKSATPPEIIEQVHDMLLDDQRVKVHEIAETIGISKECVGYTLHVELDMKKLCARWVLRLLTADQKRTCMKISEQCLVRFNKNKTDFVLQFITMDSPFHTKIQTAIKTVDSSQLFSVKKHEVGSISRKGHGIGVLGC
jgi:histone-lysine N-methyltransferase SETMAR